LHANPEIEDLVLQILANGVYGDTGISNTEYFKDSNHHPELVARFNESRLGRFVRSGNLGDLGPSRNHPTSLPATLRRTDEVMHIAGKDSPRRQPAPIIEGEFNSTRASLEGSSIASPMRNPHGAPQNPRDIYTQSDDIQRQVPRTNLPSQSHSRSPSQRATQTPAWQAFGASSNGDNDPTFENNDLIDNYKALNPRNVDGFRAPETLEAEQSHDMLQLGPLSGVPQLGQGHIVATPRQDAEAVDFGVPQTTQWSEFCVLE
jgi:hypothetical protein